MVNAEIKILIGGKEDKSIPVVINGGIAHVNVIMKLLENKVTYLVNVDEYEKTSVAAASVLAEEPSNGKPPTGADQDE